MEIQGQVDYRLYRAGFIYRPLGSKLAEREPTAKEIQTLENFSLIGGLTADEVYKVKGPDVSVWQGEIDWARMASKTYFAYIRAGYGTSGVDTRYEANVRGAHAHGRGVGVYHYLKPEKDAKKTAQHFYQLYSDSGSHLEPGYDLEETGGLDKAGLNNWMIKFINEMNNLAGTDLEGNVYSSKYFMDTYVMNNKSFDWPKWVGWWIASWTTAMSPSLPICMTQWNNPLDWDYWQYTSKAGGLEHGAQSKGLDMNRFSGTLDAFNERYGLSLEPLDGDTPPPPPPPPPPPGDSVRMKVTASVLNVRSGPSTSNPIIKTLKSGDVVGILNVGGTSAWVEIEPGKWACVQLNTSRFMEPTE